MNIKKIEKQLKKINQLFDNIKEDGTVSAIERDLLLSYVRGLYEKIIVTEKSSDNNAAPVAAAKPRVEEKAPVVEEIAPPANNIAEVVMKEVVEADQFTSQTASSPQVQSSYSAPQQEVAVQEIKEEPKPEVPQELVKLFEFEAVNELSDKLSRSPIADLTKCMGINEKIFTVQELFGGNSELFTRSMEALDKFNSLEQARDYLVENVAVEQKWAEEGKVKKATNFIKLISRRY